MNIKTPIALALVLAAFGAEAAVSDFTVNGKRVTAAEQERVIRLNVTRGQTRNEQLEQAVKGNLIMRTAMVQEAEKLKLDKTAEVRDAIADARTDILVQAAVNKYLKEHPATQSELKNLYDNQKAAYGDTEFLVSHITAQTLADAQKALDRINVGEKFDKVAKEVSLDERTKNKGGDLGWISPSIFPPNAANLMRNMKKGQTVSSPVAIQGGYDIFTVVDTRAAKNFPTYEKAKPELERAVQGRKANEYVRSVVSKANVSNAGKAAASGSTAKTAAKK